MPSNENQPENNMNDIENNLNNMNDIENNLNNMNNDSNNLHSTPFWKKIIMFLFGLVTFENTRKAENSFGMVLWAIVELICFIIALPIVLIILVIIIILIPFGFIIGGLVIIVLIVLCNAKIEIKKWLNVSDPNIDDHINFNN